MDRLPDHMKSDFIRHLEENQIRDSLKMFNVLTENCFDKCVVVGWGGGLTSKSLTEVESKCITNCGDKFMKLTQRAGFRFQEFQALQTMQAQQMQPK